MQTVVHTVYYLTAAGYLALAALAFLDWIHNRGRARAWLAAGLGFLALVPLASRVDDVLGTTPPALQALAVAAFVFSGYCILRFRDALVPLRRFESRIAIAGSALLVGLGLATALPLASRFRSAAGLVLILGWAVLVGEPIVRFWIVSRGLPRIQRYRMRSLAIGLGVLVVILLVSGLAGAAAQTYAGQLASQLVALAMVPVIVVSFAPPAWLRSQWRLGVESQLNAANRDLLIFSPSPSVLAGKAADWAARLVGGRGAFIVGADGSVLASTGIEAEVLPRVVELASRVAADSTGYAAHLVESLVVVPLPLQDGRGLIAVVGGPFTPVFGSDEVTRLEAYASSIAAGIERTHVTQRLAAMERAKTQFLNLASHELRGPVTVVRGYVSMLASGLLGQLNPTGRQAVDVMTAKIVQINSLIEEMIEAARLEEGRLELKKGIVDLREVVKTAAETIAPLVDADHRLVVELGAAEVRVDVDRDRLQTVLTNLIDNAIKYSPDGGEVRCSILVESGQARVAIEDHGLGIPPEGLEILFTRFGRVAVKETAHIPGTGLGLYLSRELARMHGGDLTVETEHGQGSVFTLDLPIAAVAAASRESRSGRVPV